MSGVDALPERPGPAPEPEARRAELARLARAWARPTGWRRFSEVNNSAVGSWYMLAAFGFFLFAGVLALLMRTQLAVPENDLISAERYDQVFTLHGSVMMFLFAVPIVEAFAIQVLPAMTGARDLPFPRLSAFGFWSFVLGGVFVCGSIFFNVAPSGGWFMYPPLTTRYSEGIGADIWLLGLSFVEIASLAAAVELIVGILKCRAPGMRINLMPLYAWYMLVVAGMILLAFPPLIVGDLLFELERSFDWPFFDAARGGDPLLWQHMFWIFGHPEVYVIFLPAIALVAMILPTFAQRPMVGYSWIVLAAVGVGFLSFGLWVHHMFTTGLPAVSLGFFSAASTAVAIPTGVQIFCFLATLLAGRLVRSTAMLFVAGALAIFVLGGLSGVMVAVAPFDFQAHDTYFVVAHLHYVLIGGMVFPVVAGFYYYYPLIAGRMLSERLGRWVFWLMFVGFNVAFLPMHISGLGGMPRRVYTYRADLGLDLLNLVSTVGAFVLAGGIALLLFDLLLGGRRRSGPTRRNPWNAGSLEWTSHVPGANWGTGSIPIVRSRYPLWDQQNLICDVDDGRFYLPDTAHGHRETLVTSTIDARPLQLLRVPGPSYAPLVSAVLVGGLFIASVFHAWTLAIASGLAGLVAILWWLWTGTARIHAQDSVDVGLGLQLPVHASGPGSVGWWGMLITMIGDAAALATLLFAYFYFWTVREVFPPQAGPGVLWPGLGTAALAGGWAATLAARRLNASGRRGMALLLLGLGALCCAAGSCAWVFAPLHYSLVPSEHVYPAMVWVMVIWLVGHNAVGLLLQLYCMARILAGRLTARHDTDLSNATLYWHFLIVTGVLSFGTLSLFPLARLP